MVGVERRGSSSCHVVVAFQGCAAESRLRRQRLGTQQKEPRTLERLTIRGFALLAFSASAATGI